MDYLIKEGYPSAAEKFAKEANIEMEPDSSAIEQRVEIRKAILRGDLQNAIELINDLNIEVRPPFTTFSCPSRIKLVSCTTHSSLIKSYDEKQNTFSPQYDRKHKHIIFTFIIPPTVC
jgi:hypothetical protein